MAGVTYSVHVHVQHCSDIYSINILRYNISMSTFCKTFLCKGKGQRHITLVERLKSHTATSEALVMSQAKLA